MAAVIQRNGSKIWTALFRDWTGRSHCLSTGQTDKQIATIIASEWQRAARLKRSKAQTQRVIDRLHELIGSEPIKRAGVPVPETVHSICGPLLSGRDLARRDKRLDLLREELANHPPKNGWLNKRFWEIVRGIGCTACGFSKWPSILQFHHIDEEPTNNALSNLTVLCPNCHRALHRKVATVPYQSIAQLLEMVEVPTRSLLWKRTHGAQELTTD
jgi:hypothetical protein